MVRVTVATPSALLYSATVAPGAAFRAAYALAQRIAAKDHAARLTVTVC